MKSVPLVVLAFTCACQLAFLITVPASARAADVTLSAKSPAAVHLIDERGYTVIAKHPMVLQSIAPVTIDWAGDGHGRWAKPTVSTGSLVNFDESQWNDSAEKPTKLVFSPAQELVDYRRFIADGTFPNTPAGSSESKPGETIDTNAASQASTSTEPDPESELARLVDSYSNDTHVLRLPRWASKTSNAKETLPNFQRWVLLDRLFVLIGLDKHPTATPPDVQRVARLIDDRLEGKPPEKEDAMLSPQEIQRMAQALSFEIQSRWIPYAGNQPDRGWQHPFARAHLGEQENQVDRIEWTGRLDPVTAPTAWLQIDADAPLKQPTASSNEVRQDWVQTNSGGQFLRLSLNNPKQKKPAPFTVTIGADRGARPIKIIHEPPHEIRLPF